MEAIILTLKNEKKNTMKLPEQFNEPIRTDLIHRAFVAVESRERQPYGAHPEAGQRQAAKLSRRRREYKGAYGMGISRVPRKTLSRQGTKMHYVGAVAPGTVKGRQAHPPKSGKIWTKQINAKENRKAIRSALAATLDKEIVAKRGHRLPAQYPFILDTNAEGIGKTKELQKALNDLGLGQEMERTANRKIRAGRGKMRGRKYKQPSGPLIVTSAQCKLTNAGSNIPGVQVVQVNSLNAKLLAPGGMPGRITIFTQAAMEKLKQDKLYC